MKTEKEAKQEAGKEFYESADKVITIKRQEEAKQRAKNSMALKGALDVKEETLEEAAEKEFPLIDTEWCKTGAAEEENLQLLGHRKSFIEGAKWQAERMYSEEEVDNLLNRLLNNNMCSQIGDELIEQFKKK